MFLPISANQRRYKPFRIMSLMPLDARRLRVSTAYGTSAPTSGNPQARKCCRNLMPFLFGTIVFNNSINYTIGNGDSLI